MSVNLPELSLWTKRERLMDQVSLLVVAFFLGWAAAGAYYQVPNLWELQRACPAWWHLHSRAVAHEGAVEGGHGFVRGKVVDGRNGGPRN